MAQGPRYNEPLYYHDTSKNTMVITTPSHLYNGIVHGITKFDYDSTVSRYNILW